MASSIRLAAVLAAVCALSAPAHAENVYRCGESYSNQPCPGATVVPTDDPRSAAQRAESLAATKRDARLADQLQMDRLKREAEVTRERAMAAKATKAATPASAPASSGKRPASQGKLKKPELFTAVAPSEAAAATGQKKTKKKKANTDPE